MTTPDPLAIYLARKAEEAAALRPRVIRAASEEEAMWDQFSELMSVGADDSRYLAIRSILLQPFEERAEIPLVMVAG